MIQTPDQIKVNVKVFHTTGLCAKTEELEITLEEGSFCELQKLLGKALGVNLGEIKALMFLHNGCVLDRRKSLIFKNMDTLWLLPLLSGG